MLNARWDTFPNAPAPGTRLCGVGDVEERTAREFRFGEGRDAFSMLLTRRDGELRGYVNACPHFQLPLNAPSRPDRLMTIDGERLKCAHHLALFCPLTGLCVDGPAKGDSLIRVPLDIRDGAVFISDSNLPRPGASA
jgi:nitrite reductase/ring-hydroxylating ferredoxin subunit